VKKIIYCPYCGTKVNYEEPEGACLITEYPQCPNCDTYIYLVGSEQDYIVRQIKIEMVNCK